MGDIVTNPKARRDYHIVETFEAGLVLKGTEVKSLRGGRGQIADAFARVDGEEIFLHNAHIDEYAQGNRFNHAPKAARKLLLHKRELLRLRAYAEQGGHALVPLAFFWKNRKVKCLLAVGKSKAEFDKREDIKRRDADRELRRVTMHRLKR